jgi:FAD/FMN-containing dehydrogenase
MILTALENSLEGTLHSDQTLRTLYATDASAYREMPLAVAIPKTKEDIRKIINFARENKISIVPRAAGTSLAGQVVGNGIIVDISKNFTKIVEVNKEAHYVIVEPGVIRDDLNHHLKQFGLFYGPETSTSNRCMIGGMVGNNACGARSVVYGSAREHLISIKGFLADGSEVEFGSLTEQAFEDKCAGKNVTGSFRTVYLSASKNIVRKSGEQKII